MSLDELKGKRFPVLDDGGIALIDSMGSDAAICEAARISYGKGTKSVSDDRTLIRYLYRHKHMSPFEMAEIKLWIRLPLDAMRQLIRHRTASVNEYSTRYSEAIDSMQATAPDAWRLQSGANKQGSSHPVTDWPDGYRIREECYFDADDDAIYEGGTDTFLVHADGWKRFEAGEAVTPGTLLSSAEREFQEYARAVYANRLKFGVSREQARKDLPLSTYTEAYWKCDLRNVFGFLAQRMDSHAQLEIRSYAEVIGREIVAKLFPLAWEAFEDYTLGAVTLSASELRVVKWIVRGETFEMAAATIANAREREECRAKLATMNLA